MGTSLMPVDEERVYSAIGQLQSKISELSRMLEELRTDTTHEQRTVHTIVVATNEAIRNLARTVERMEPPVKEYQLKSASIDESIALTDDYREKRAEQRGADKFKKWLYGLAASVGGLIAILMNKAIDRFFSVPPPGPPHP